jgi:hypothetical protein
MEKDYDASKPFDYAIKGSSQVGPAKEIGTWKDQRIFLFGSGGKDWRTGETDIIKTFGGELKRINGKNHKWGSPR